MPEQSFMKSLFHGVVEEGGLFPFPEAPREAGDTANRLVESVRRYFEKNVDSKQIDLDEKIPQKVLDDLKELGLFGMAIPTAYGGGGMSHTTFARVMEEIGALDSSIAVTLGAHQSIGLEGILLFGTEAQKAKYLPKLATGEHVASFALTEPGAGSDAAAIQTRAEKRGDKYILNGSKVWITNGAFADIFTVFARTSSSEDGAKPRLTAFIVERGKGLTIGKHERKLGIRGASTTEVFFDNVEVPEANVLGEVGRGFKVAMEVLNNGRIVLAAGCVGGAKRLIRMAVERAEERKAFGRAIGEFGLIKDKIAEMMAETYALESMTYMTTGLVDRRAGDYSVESAICKVYGSETLWRVANETLQIAAGTGYMCSYPYERFLRDARINLIFEGTNEILRCFIALSGMQGPGEELAEVSKAMREPIKGFGLLSDFALRKAKSALGRERVSRAHPVLAREAVILEEFTSDLARNVDKVLRRHGRNIAEMQFTQKRVADMAIDLYAIASVLSRTSRAIETRGEEGARREISLANVFVAQAEIRLRETAQSFDKNDDELRKSIASKAYNDGGYPLDIL